MLLADLVINCNNGIAQTVLPASNSAVEGTVTPANTGEFDFSALSSKEDNGKSTPLTSSIHEHVNGTKQAEIQLTEEEDNTVSALLSLSKSMPSENSQDIDNSKLLPIGKVTVDAAPVPIRLGVEDINREIAKLTVPNDANETKGSPEQKQTSEVTMTIIANGDGSVLSATSNITDTQRSLSLPNSPKMKGAPPEDSLGSPRGDFQLRSYKLKKKGSKPRKYACKSCNAVKDLVQELNEHHKQRHEQVMCGTCKKLFDVPLALARHMYEHYEKNILCDRCDQCFTFQSELEKHKIIHWKTPTFKCMKANCDRWFFRNQDLNFHLQTHKKTELKCPHCDKFSTNTDKYLKEHIKSVHSKRMPYKCTKCDKRFMYRQQRKRHLDSDHK